jgi:hypothetical protein
LRWMLSYRDKRRVQNKFTYRVEIQVLFCALICYNSYSDTHICFQVWYLNGLMLISAFLVFFPLILVSDFQWRQATGYQERGRLHWSGLSGQTVYKYSKDWEKRTNSAQSISSHITQLKSVYMYIDLSSAKSVNQWIGDWAGRERKFVPERIVALLLLFPNTCPSKDLLCRSRKYKFPGKQKSSWPTLGDGTCTTASCSNQLGRLHRPAQSENFSFCSLLPFFSTSLSCRRRP